MKQKWIGVVWLNPPFSEIAKWMKKAYEEACVLGNAEVVVCLVPASTDTRWWHDYATKGEVTFLKGRLKFGNATNSAPFPSALVVFRRKR